MTAKRKTEKFGDSYNASSQLPEDCIRIQNNTISKTGNNTRDTSIPFRSDDLVQFLPLYAILKFEASCQRVQFVKGQIRKVGCVFWVKLF